MEKETLLKFLFLDLVLIFDIFLIWFAITEQTILPVAVAVMGTIIHWPEFVATMNFSKMHLKQKLWLFLAMDSALIIVIYTALTGNIFILVFYTLPAILTMIYRSGRIDFPIVKLGGVPA